LAPRARSPRRASTFSRLDLGLAALGCAAVLQNFDENASAWLVIPVGIAVPVVIGLVWRTR